MKILGLETSCDETAASVVEDGTRILSNIISSQIDIHSRYGGVVPEVASRQHLLNIISVVQSAMNEAKLDHNDLDAVAVTYGPGLAGSLLVGVNIAKSLSYSFNLPLIGINHLEGHIYANWLNSSQPVFPCLCLIVSGGHSDTILMTDHMHFKKIGQTRDDAAGEAFDKGARILGLGYPGGPHIEKAALNGNPSFKHPRAWMRGTDDFSFSGIKTALLHTVQNLDNIDKQQTSDLACSFQNNIIEVLAVKTIEAASRLDVKQILLAGGVAANKALSGFLISKSKIPVLIPPPVLCTDNAAMIASCAFFHFVAGNTSGYDLDVNPGLSFS
jgi:N6-L-threonylcarbamoyladenine synthase